MHTFPEHSSETARTKIALVLSTNDVSRPRGTVPRGLEASFVDKGYLSSSRFGETLGGMVEPRRTVYYRDPNLNGSN